MKLKKIPRYLALFVLTGGASLILGFLSFGGMFVMWPVLPIAFAAFGLSVAYEGEVYLQNIKGAWSKLFKRDYFKNELANDYLLSNFPEDTTTKECPQFFRDYEAQLNLLHQFGHKRLDKASSARKKQVEKTLRDMERWFAKQLFAPTKQHKAETLTPYENELRAWLAAHHQDEQQALLDKRQKKFLWVKGFSALVAVFMSLGTTYLLVEAFSVIPMFSAIPVVGLPLLLVPMSIIAGTAYGLLTYNSVTDMMTNDTISKWYNKLRNDLSQGLTLRNVFMATTALILLALAVALTVCTAGTWWTVVKSTPPLFSWMSRIPGFVMGVINPIITGSAALVFNIQNTSESLEMIDDATHTKPGFFTRTIDSIKERFQSLREQENWLQIINPFRLLLKVTIAPLRIALFFGHLISIGVTSNRVPGISAVFSAILGIISEGFEDAHYFIVHNHHEHEHEHEHEHDNERTHKKALLQERLSAGHGHTHDVDLPTKAIKFLAAPVYFLAAVWDYLASKGNSGTREDLSFHRAWEKQMGIPKEESVKLPNNAQRPSANWQMEHMVYRIEDYKEKHLHTVSVGGEIAQQKSVALTKVQHDLREMSVTDRAAIKERLAVAKKDPIYHAHRFFAGGKTATATFVEELPERIGLCAG